MAWLWRTRDHPSSRVPCIQPKPREYQRLTEEEAREEEAGESKTTHHPASIANQEASDIDKGDARDERFKTNEQSEVMKHREPELKPRKELVKSGLSGVLGLPI